MYTFCSFSPARRSCNRCGNAVLTKYILSRLVTKSSFGIHRKYSWSRLKFAKARYIHIIARELASCTFNCFVQCLFQGCQLFSKWVWTEILPIITGLHFSHSVKLVPWPSTDEWAKLVVVKDVLYFSFPLSIFGRKSNDSVDTFTSCEWPEIEA